jgi:simple sugar transport system permease protein/D-xylose transport system permease protein
MTQVRRDEGMTKTALDLQDERLQQMAGLSGAIRAFPARVRSGDLGALPVVVGLVIIAVVFQVLNPLFLSSPNLVNLTLEASSVGVISLGIVCVLLLGEIDLSVGSVSGLSGAILAVLAVQHGWPAAAAIAVSLIVGLLIGVIYGLAFNYAGMPSFVVTLAGLLGFLGAQLFVLGAEGSINIPFDSGVVRFAQRSFLPRPTSYVVMAIIALLVFVSGVDVARSRRRAGLSATSAQFLLVRAIVILVLLEFGCWYLNRSRGVAWMFLIFAALVVVMNYMFTRTGWGRWLFAIGGNVEAARRAGIPVRRVYLSAFALCSTFAAAGGILAAARLGSANQSAGAGDVNLNAIAAAVIGGTSLFGGRGSAYSAFLGILVISAISSGLTLLNLSSSIRFMITGAVLALAVAVDSLARRSRAAHGRV